MKKSRRFISLLLSIVMLFSITTSIDLSAYAYTSGDFQYEIELGDETVEIANYIGLGGNVTIPSTIDGYTVTSIGYGAFENCTSLTSVTIPNSVTSIGGSAFRECTSLTSVTIPNSVTSIGGWVFYNCTSLTSVTIPDGVTSIGSYAFEYCTSLASVTIPSSVTSIGAEAFAYCASLTSVTIPNSVTSFGSSAMGSAAFYGVNNIVYNGSATGSPWGAKSVNGYVDGFLVYKDSTKKELLGCSAQAVTVTIPDSVTSIRGGAFEYCSSLTSVTIPNSVTRIGDYAFRECTSLTSVTIPDSVTSIGDGAFSYCTSLTSVTIPKSVTNIGRGAFSGCSKIKYVFYSGNRSDWQNIRTEEYGFQLTDNAKIHYYSTGDHYWNSGAVTKQPTCTENGLKTYTCTVCNETKEETINATGHSYTNQVVPPTCTTQGYTNHTCTKCGYEYNSDETSALGHLFENYTAVDSQNHKAICSRENCNVADINSHNFVNDTCEVCGCVSIDTTAYDDALAEANAIMGASDYTTKYLASSRTAYENAVNAAIRDDFLTQEEADSAASAIISAKSLLTYSQSTVDFYIVDENGNITNQISETVSYGDVLTLNAGDYISDSDRITKWVAISGVNSNESKVATSQRSYTMVVTKPVKIYAHYVTIPAESTVKYSRITFIGKNGCVIEVKYVKEGEDLDTSTVEAPVIPFYEFIGWNKTSVTANGSDIFVKANYKFIETEEDKCKVHYVQNGNIIVKSYAYDSFVYIYGAEDKKLALSTDGTTAGIITYLDENAFYAPHCSDIYVIEVEEMNSSIGITGSYSYVTDENKIAAFNCKAYLPEGFTLVECGLIASSENGSMKVEAGSVSPRGEYCIEILLDKNTQITAVKGKAYLVFKNSSGDLVTIESDEITQSL